MSANASRFSVPEVCGCSRPALPMTRPAFRLPCARVLILGLSLVAAILEPRPAVAQSEEEAALLEAARQRDVDAVSALLAAGVNVNAQSREGVTALMEAAGEGALDLTSLLLDRGADVDVRTRGEGRGTDVRRSGVTALMMAAFGGSLDVVALLLDRGADVNHVGNSGTALIGALVSDHPDVATLLLDRGADVNVLGGHPDLPGMLYTPLMWVAVALDARPDVATLLLDRGADENARTGEHREWQDAGLTALMLAAAAGNVGLVTLLLERGADVHAVSRQGRTALAYADLMRQRETAALLGPRTGEAISLGQVVATGDVDQVSLMLDGGADANARSDKGWPVLVVAAAEGHLPVASLLLERGADVNAEGEGLTALMWAVLGGHSEVVALLLESDVDVTAVHPWGGTALDLAVQEGHDEIVGLLRPRTELIAALQEALGEGNVQQVAAALDRGADANARLRGYPALMWAAQVGAPDMVAMLLERGADVNAVDQGGETALMWAAQVGAPDMVALLLERGADVNAVDQGGETALDMAARDGQDEIVVLLLEAAGVADQEGDPLRELREQLLKQNLRNLSWAMAVYYAEKGTFTEDLAHVDWRPIGNVMHPTLALHVSGNGWAGTMVHENDPSVACTIYVGASAEDADVPEDTPQCIIMKEDPGS